MSVMYVHLLSHYGIIVITKAHIAVYLIFVFMITQVARPTVFSSYEDDDTAPAAIQQVFSNR